jgi:hypothetical protein
MANPLDLEFDLNRGIERVGTNAQNFAGRSSGIETYLDDPREF